MYRDSVTDVFFDLDHTLWDFDRNSALTFHKIFQTNGVGVGLEDFLQCYAPINLAFWKLYRDGRILPSELRFQRLKSTFDALHYAISDEGIHLLTEQYMEHLCTFNHLLPHAMDILEYLRPKYNLHIITNGFQEIQDKKLRNAGIRHYFDHVVDSEMAGVKKPDPGIYQLALKMAGVSPQNAIMIGDSLEADVMGARAQGLYALHFNVHGDPAHEYCNMIYGLHEIKSYL